MLLCDIDLSSFLIKSQSGLSLTLSSVRFLNTCLAAVANRDVLNNLPSRRWTLLMSFSGTGLAFHTNLIPRHSHQFTVQVRAVEGLKVRR